MRQSHLTDLERVVVLLLLEHLIAQLQSLELIRIVVEVDSRRGLLQEIRAFHFDLSVIVRNHLIITVILITLPQISSFEPVDAVVLIWLIDLRQDYLLKVYWLGFGLAEKGLEVVSDGGL